MNISYEELQLIKERLSYNPATGIFVYSKYFSGMQPGTVAGTARPDGYLSVYINYRAYLTHRLAIIWDLNKEELDKIDFDLQVDHINNIRADNRRINLRFATSSQNSHNSKGMIDSISGIKGLVQRHNGSYNAQIACKGKRVTKTFKEHQKEEAMLWLQETRELIHKEFTNHNSST